MKDLNGINVAHLLHVLAAKIEEDDIRPTSIAVSETHLSVEFYEIHRIDTAKGEGE